MTRVIVNSDHLNAIHVASIVLLNNQTSRIAKVRAFVGTAMEQSMHHHKKKTQIRQTWFVNHHSQRFSSVHYFHSQIFKFIALYKYFSLISTLGLCNYIFIFVVHAGFVTIYSCLL